MGQKLLRDAQEKGKMVKGWAVLDMVSLSGIRCCFEVLYCVNTIVLFIKILQHGNLSTFGEQTFNYYI